MRLLLLTQIVPYPPDSGPKIKTYNVLRFLAQRHEIHLLSFSRSAKEDAQARELEDTCASVTTVSLSRSRVRDGVALAASLVNGQPFLIERDASAAMDDAIRHIIGKHQFDAVHADQLSMAQFAMNLPIPLRVLDEHNAVWSIVQRAAKREHWGPRRFLAELEWRKLREYEGAMCRSFDQITTVSDEDLDALSNAARYPLVARVVPIAVDTVDWAFAPRSPLARHVTSVATMYYPPNVEGVHWFATDVFPQVRRTQPGTTFQVVGSRPPVSITRLAIPKSGVDVMGYVDDLTSVYANSGVVVVPVRSGSGMRVKILEAFARGIPVVSTSMGVEGIDAEDGKHLLIADNARSFADAVIQILRQPHVAARLAHAARDLVERRYDWRTALNDLDEIYPAVERRPVPAIDGSR